MALHKVKHSKKLLLSSVSLIIVVGGLYLTLFTGFCRGWWGLDNILAHYWWRCACGPEFEQSLYPNHITVIVSSCREVSHTRLSSDGRYLALEDNQGSRLIDFVTEQEKPWPYPFEGYGNYFWTDTLYLIGTDKMWQLVDVADNQSLNIEAFEVVTPFRETPDGLPAATIEPFRQANQVLVSKSGTMALALAENPKHPEAKNYILLFTHPNGVVGPDDIVNELFENYGITYNQVTRGCNSILLNRIELCLSHDERFVTNTIGSGLGTSEGQGIVSDIEGEGLFIDGSGLIGWAHDNSGIYVGIGHEYISGRPGGLFNWGLAPEIRLPSRAIVKIELPGNYSGIGPKAAVSCGNRE